MSASQLPTPAAFARTRRCPEAGCGLGTSSVVITLGEPNFRIRAFHLTSCEAPPTTRPLLAGLGSQNSGAPMIAAPSPPLVKAEPQLTLSPIRHDPCCDLTTELSRWPRCVSAPASTQSIASTVRPRRSTVRLERVVRHQSPLYSTSHTSPIDIETTPPRTNAAPTTTYIQ
jgi:hypothetical protein